MGTFKEHIHQSQSNIGFLSKISTNLDNCWDWQVTVCFYSALHLINAHIVIKTDANYLSHSKVDELINPYNTFSLAKLDEKICMSYIKLFQLSRRSRYLLSENFKKAIYHLDIIINFIKMITVNHSRELISNVLT